MTKVETSAVTDPLLLPTRLFVPVLDPEIVSRDRLLDLLQSASSTRLLLVSAPAGSGKTTLVADWVRRGHRPAAWLSMEAVEADAASFVGGLVEAVGGLAPAASAPARALMASAPPPEPRTIAMALATGLATAAIRATVVLDDYHVVSDPVSHEILTLLIERVPHGLQLVLITRSDPPLPLARMRARRQLREVRAADLRFTDEESARFIAHYCRQDLTSEEVATLTERTEGWAAGLQLAGLALRQAADPGRFVAGFKGTHTYVADFLTDEVLAGIPVEDQRFLVRTSLLRRFTGALCDAALERSGSQPLLESLNRANLFLVPLDAERRWFRFHHLFGDLLRRRALEEPADLRRALEPRGGVTPMARRMTPSATPWRRVKRQRPPISSPDTGSRRSRRARR
jgi:LuxR family maltose regulon positive regulatory protein